MLARRERWPGRTALIRAGIAGPLWFGVYMVSLNAAEPWVDAGTSALLINWVWLGQVPPALAVPGGLLCLAGVAIARR